MSKVRIVTDSLSDIPMSLIKELDITTVPIIVRFGRNEFRDRVDLFPWEFYQRLSANPEPPTTAVPALRVFQEAYQRLAQETDQILAIHTIASLTGIYNASQLAAQEIQNARIELIDSQQVSMSLGWLVILAARAAKEGRSLNEIKTLVQDVLPRVHIVGMLDTLKYAQRGGRLGKGAALLGTLLNVKPLLSATGGEIVPIENVRTRKKAIAQLAEIAMASGPIQEVAVIHAQALELALSLQKIISQILPSKQALLCETGPVLGAHTGPGSVGIAWVTSKN